MIVYKVGDVLNSGELVVVHGCNCKNAMGAGIARQVRAECRDAYNADQATMWGDRGKLGHFTYGLEPNGMTVINAYTQYDYTRDKVDVDYQAVESVMTEICQTFPNTIIAMPKIGCGLAGGDWNIVSEILERVSNLYNKVFHVYELTRSIT